MFLQELAEPSRSELTDVFLFFWRDLVSDAESPIESLFHCPCAMGQEILPSWIITWNLEDAQGPECQEA